MAAGTGNTVSGITSVVIGGNDNVVTADKVVMINTDSVTGSTSRSVYLGDVTLTKGLSYNTSNVDATADPSLLVTDNVVFYNTSAPGGTIYLPAAKNGKEIILIRIGNTNSAFVAGTGSAKINGVGIAQNLPTVLYTKTTFISNGTDWYANDSTPL